MNEVQIFNSPEFGTVRTVTINKEPWFVAKDVADILGYQNGSRDINRHVDEDDRADVAIHDGRQNRNMTVINESGMYALIFGSKLLSAKRFKHWVTSEVLPSIRKTGKYEQPSRRIKIYLNHPVVTLHDIDVFHNLEPGSARSSLGVNFKKLIPEYDYFIYSYDDYIDSFNEPYGGTPGNVGLLTESGYRIIAAPFVDGVEQMRFIQEMLCPPMQYTIAPPATPAPAIQEPEDCLTAKIVSPTKKVRDAIDFCISAYAAVYNYYSLGGTTPYHKLKEVTGYEYLNNIGSAVINNAQYFGRKGGGHKLKPDEDPFFLFNCTSARSDGTATLPRIGNVKLSNTIIIPPNRHISSAKVWREGAKNYYITFNTRRTK